MSDTGHWICEKFQPKAFGFIYIVTNLTNNRKYIGKNYNLEKKEN
jgi:hypothetical protein